MITNEFFKGYFQALNLVEDVVKNLQTSYEDDKTITAKESLEAVVSAIQGVRTSYQELVIQLNREMNETK